jgi:surface carbohydrate biosynthesis protein (TIGR04326 family)
VHKSKTLLIWDSEAPLPGGDEYKVLWQSYNIENLETEVSISQLIEDNADWLKSEYLALIYELGEAKMGSDRVVDFLEISPDFSYWWMTLLTEKCNYSKSPQIGNVIKLIALNLWLKDKYYSAIKLVSDNVMLVDSMQILTKKLGIKFDCQRLPIKNTDSLIRKVHDNLPNLFKVIIYLSSYLTDRWSLRGVGIDRWKSSIATTTFVSYFTNIDLDLLKQGRYKSEYWSELPDALEKKNIESNWLHIYVKSESIPTVSSAKRLVEKFNKVYQGKQNHLFLDSFLSVGVVRKAVFSWLVLAYKQRKVEKVLKNHAGYFWPLLRDDFRSSLTGVTAIQNLLSLYLFKSAMMMLIVQKKGAYLQENQGWEFGFISAWSEFGHKSLVGVPHSTVRYWDLRYFFDPRSYIRRRALDLPLPDKVGVNGTVAKNTYINGGYPASGLVKLEALRYLQLGESISSVSKKNKHKTTAAGVKLVLVLGDYLPKNTVSQMELLQKASQFVKSKVKYIVKPHPMCPILIDNYPELDAIITNRAINQLIDDCVLAYTSSVTSAAVDVYCTGKPVVTILDPATLNISPLRNIQETSFVSTPKELADVINKVDWMSSTGTRSRDYFYLDYKLPKWSEFFMKNN